MNVSSWHACVSTVAIVLVTHTHTHTHRTEIYRDQDISTYTGKPTECNHCEHNKGIGSIPRTRVRALQQEVFSLRSGVVVQVLVADLLQIRGRYGLSDTAPAKANTMNKEQTRASVIFCICTVHMRLCECGRGGRNLLQHLGRSLHSSSFSFCFWILACLVA